MKIIDLLDRQNLAVALKGYCLYKNTHTKVFSSEEITFLKDLEKIAIDNMRVLNKNLPFTMLGEK